MSRLPLALALLLYACSTPTPTPEASGEKPLTGTYTYDHEVGIFDGTDFVPSPTTDHLVLVEDGDSLRVALNLVRANAHLCGWSGMMAPEGEGWVSREPLDLFDDTSTCTLRLEMTADTLTLRDEDYQCRRYYCGARGTIDGAAFARSTWSPDTSTVDF